MADEDDSRTASVGKRKSMNGDYDDVIVKRSRMSQSDDYVPLDSPAESGEIEEDEDEDDHEHSLKRFPTDSDIVSAAEADSIPPPPPPGLSEVDIKAKEAPPLPEGPPPVLLSDLPPELQALQRRYWPHASDYSLAICEICSSPGHISLTCPNRTCSHCSVDIASPDGHFSSACPKFAHCKRCGGDGHTSTACKSKLAAAADEISSVFCENCLLPGHELQQCEWLWRTYTPIVADLASVIPSQLQTGIPVSRRTAQPPPKSTLLHRCYNCAKETHLGDDCPLLPRTDGPKQMFGLFSAEWSNLFALNPHTPPPPRPSGGGVVAQPKSHIIFTDDSDGEKSMDISDDDAGSRPPTQSQQPRSKPARRRRPRPGKATQEPAYTFQPSNPGPPKNKKQDIKFSTGPDSFMAQSQGQSHNGMNATGLPPKPPPPRNGSQGSLESRITGGGLSRGGRGRIGGNRLRGGGGGGGF